MPKLKHQKNADNKDQYYLDGQPLDVGTLMKIASPNGAVSGKIVRRRDAGAAELSGFDDPVSTKFEPDRLWFKPDDEKSGLEISLSALSGLGIECAF